MGSTSEKAALDRRLLVTIGIPSVIGSFAGGFLGSVIPAWVILAAVAVAVLWQGSVFLIQGRRESREGDGGGSQVPYPSKETCHSRLLSAWGSGSWDPWWVSPWESYGFPPWCSF